MTYDVRLVRHAEAYLRRLDARTRERVTRQLERIAGDPYGPFSKQLTNAEGRRSVRVGDIRILYSVDDVERVVLVSAIGPRGHVYRDL